MTRLEQETRYPLARRELVALDDAREHLIRCESGLLWVTMERAGGDLVLGPGESCRSVGGVPVVISALESSVLAISHPPGCLSACAPRREGAGWTLAALLRWRFAPLAGAPAIRVG